MLYCCLIITGRFKSLETIQNTHFYTILHDSFPVQFVYKPAYHLPIKVFSKFVPVVLSLIALPKIKYHFRHDLLIKQSIEIAETIDCFFELRMPLRSILFAKYLFFVYRQFRLLFFYKLV